MVFIFLHPPKSLFSISWSSNLLMTNFFIFFFLKMFIFLLCVWRGGCLKWQTSQFLWIRNLRARWSGSGSFISCSQAVRRLKSSEGLTGAKVSSSKLTLQDYWNICFLPAVGQPLSFFSLSFFSKWPSS